MGVIYIANSNDRDYFSSLFLQPLDGCYRLRFHSNRVHRALNCREGAASCHIVCVCVCYLYYLYLMLYLFIHVIFIYIIWYYLSVLKYMEFLCTFQILGFIQTIVFIVQIVILIRRIRKQAQELSSPEQESASWSHSQVIPLTT